MCVCIFSSSLLPTKNKELKKCPKISSYLSPGVVCNVPNVVTTCSTSCVCVPNTLFLHQVFFFFLYPLVSVDCCTCASHIGRIVWTVPRTLGTNNKHLASLFHCMVVIIPCINFVKTSHLPLKKSWNLKAVHMSVVQCPCMYVPFPSSTGIVTGKRWMGLWKVTSECCNSTYNQGSTGSVWNSITCVRWTISSIALWWNLMYKGCYIGRLTISNFPYV